MGGWEISAKTKIKGPFSEPSISEERGLLLFFLKFRLRRFEHIGHGIEPALEIFNHAVKIHSDVLRLNAELVMASRAGSEKHVFFFVHCFVFI